MQLEPMTTPAVHACAITATDRLMNGPNAVKLTTVIAGKVMTVNVKARSDVLA
jgi:hypothetical protein